MEHTQANPKTHTCAMCGYVWLHGQHGGHSCATRLKSQRDELLEALIDVIGWVPTQGWHTDAPDKAVNRARALIAKHKVPA